MEYRTFKDSNKTYIVIRTTGHGTMESPFIEHEILKEFNDLEKATTYRNNYVYSNNTNESLRSTWYDNRAIIITNINSKEGKILYDKFSKTFESKMNKAKTDSNFTKYEVDGQIIYIKKNPLFDT